jgi:predicted transposase YdaD
MFMEDLSPDLLEVLKMEDPAIAKAESVLEAFSCDQETLRLYELREKALHDEITRVEGAFEKGKEEGLIEGMQEGQIELILQLLAAKFGEIPAEWEINLRGLAPEKLKELGKAVFKVTSLDEFKNMLDDWHNFGTSMTTLFQ